MYHNSDLPPEERLILALDGLNGEDAQALAGTIRGLRWVKVGMELFVAAGPAIVETFREQGLHVFLDLKFHDIPATMAAACQRAMALGANLVTVHASAGVEAMRAAQQAVATLAGQPATTLLLAVTVLTSWRPEDFNRELAIHESLDRHVCRLAQLAMEAGLHGCVCSPRDAALLRLRYPTLQLVTPGVRPRHADPGDQARILTPDQALKAGADRLVIGRPITRAPDPERAFQRICESMAQSDVA